MERHLASGWVLFNTSDGSRNRATSLHPVLRLRLSSAPGAWVSFSPLVAPTWAPLPAPSWNPQDTFPAPTPGQGHTGFVHLCAQCLVEGLAHTGCSECLLKE